MNKALFLDRDGVVNKEKNYLYKINDFEFIDGVFETCRYFQDKGYLIIIITNQAGIARGKYSEKDFHILNDWMLEEFKKENIIISKVYYCPHHPDFTGDCNCRKPNPGMLINAQEDMNIDLEDSIFVGDKNTDIEAGISVNIQNNFLINTGHSIELNKFDVTILNNLNELTQLYKEK